MIADVGRGRSAAICGTTISVNQVPVFICTLPPHAGHFHRNLGGKAWLRYDGCWTIERGTHVAA